MINAATLSLLAGDEAAARVHALAVLETDDDDAPYYQAATRAEALLVLRRFDEAWAALRTRRWRPRPRPEEDHAVTLRQFRLLLEALGGDDAGLARLAPPRSLHFTGHMAVGRPTTRVWPPRSPAWSPRSAWRSATAPWRLGRTSWWPRRWRTRASSCTCCCPSIPPPFGRFR
ncbi:hypothetical protein ACRAWD_10365 [Caulobacter segnis]